MPKLNNSNATFLVIFKQCANVYTVKLYAAVRTSKHWCSFRKDYRTIKEPSKHVVTHFFSLLCKFKIMRISENFESFANDDITVQIKSSRKFVMANPDSKTSVEPQIEHH